MHECTNCGVYLRKLTTKRTPNLTLDEANNIVELFQTADLETMQALLVWKPEERKFAAKDQKALIAYDLYGCPTCKREAIVAKSRPIVTPPDACTKHLKC